jgi:hypothetical protein
MEYIKDQYHLAASDYRLARTESEKHEALRRMHRLSVLASTMYGFGAADSLRGENYGSGHHQDHAGRAV